jgi:hypothetical protein
MGMIVSWHNREITAGTDWGKEVAEHLQTAHLILLLISPDFIASDYCYGVEMQKALVLHEQGSAHVVPIILRPVDWRGALFAHLQVLPIGAQPITSAFWPSLDEACYDVALRLRTIIEQWQRDRATSDNDVLSKTDTDIDDKTDYVEWINTRVRKELS